MRETGIDQAISDSDTPVSRVRRLIEADPSHAWNSAPEGTQSFTVTVFDPTLQPGRDGSTGLPSTSPPM